MSGGVAPVALRVEPLRVEWIEALVLGDDVFTERFGIPVAEGWAGFPEALPFALEAARARSADPWGSHVFFDDAVDGALVGLGGYKGAPDTDGTVEVGYAIAPERRGRGLATEATNTMVERARWHGVRTVTAHTLAEPNASTAVLTRCGFRHVATIGDHSEGVDGAVWRWELQLDSIGRPSGHD